MGRGLSDLQRYIVTKAASVERLYYHDILQGYYGWPLHTDFRHMRTDEETGQRRLLPGGQFFWPEEIGVQRYHATRVSLSRAVERLQWRGLVTWLSGTRAHWSGVEITDEGRHLVATWQQTT
jgi:hypothetical protein